MHANTDFVNKKYDSVTFFNPYYFRTSVKTTFKGKKFNKAAIKCNLLTGFFNERTSRYRLSLSSFCSKHLTSNRLYLRSALSDCDAVSFS